MSALPPRHPTPSALTACLQRVYQDLTRLHEIAAPSIILHRADRDLTTPRRHPLVGIGAAQQHEENLLAATGGTLVMDVESITVSSDAVFGCVMGVLRAGVDVDGDEEEEETGTGTEAEAETRRGGEETASAGAETKRKPGRQGWDRRKRTGKGEIAVPFCGLWRFDEDGLAAEHWENAADPGALARWLRGE